MLREIKEGMFKINRLYGTPYYVEASCEKELFIFVADKAAKGEIITSVSEIRLDGPPSH